MGELENILHQDDVNGLLEEIHQIPNIGTIVVVYTTEDNKIGYQSLGNNTHIIGLLESAKLFYFKGFFDD